MPSITVVHTRLNFPGLIASGVLFIPQLSALIMGLKHQRRRIRRRLVRQIEYYQKKIRQLQEQLARLGEDRDEELKSLYHPELPLPDAPHHPRFARPSRMEAGLPLEVAPTPTNPDVSDTKAEVASHPVPITPRIAMLEKFRANIKKRPQALAIPPPQDDGDVLEISTALHGEIFKSTHKCFLYKFSYTHRILIFFFKFYLISRCTLIRVDSRKPLSPSWCSMV